MEKVFLFFFGRNRHVGHSFLSRLLMTGVFLLLVVPLALAQEQRIYIDNFVHDPMDQTAKEHPKTDANGNLYALVKVRPGAKDFKFEFGFVHSCSTYKKFRSFIFVTMAKIKHFFLTF